MLGALFQIGNDFDRCLAYDLKSRVILEKLVRVKPATAGYQELLVLGYGQISYALTRKGQSQERSPPS